jgi:hypothetical protein
MAESNFVPQLLYFPVKQYSARFGKQFFTMEIKDYRIQGGDACMSSHAVYTIKLQQEKFIWQIHRRFSEFDRLLVQLKQRYTDVEFPVLPPKTYFNVCTDANFLEERKQKLHEFSNHLLLTASKHRLFSEQKLLEFYGLDPNFTNN